MAAAPLLSGQELFSKMNALLNDPNYILPDDLTESDRNWIRTGIMLSSDPPPNPAISFANARSRTFRAPHGGRKSRNQKKRKQSRKQRRSQRRTRSFRK